VNVEVHIADAKRLKRWADTLEGRTKADLAEWQGSLDRAGPLNRRGLATALLGVAALVVTLALVWLHSRLDVAAFGVMLVAQSLNMRANHKWVDEMRSAARADGRVTGRREAIETLTREIGN
jgi:hypothetical protein